MADPAPASSHPHRELRLWPGVLLVTLQWFAWILLPAIALETKMYAFLFALACGPAILAWWLLFSRAPWTERLGVAALVVLGFVATPPLLHESVASGNMGFQFYLFAIPTVSLALVLWAVGTRRVAPPRRWIALVGVLAVACGLWTLVRSKGLTGDGSPQFVWRWSPTAEERLLAEGPEEIEAIAPSPSTEGVETSWSGFRGEDRDGVVRGPELATDWSESAPQELWRRPVGPGVSSFAVGGDLVYTQEQLGEGEVVTAYGLATGEPVWRYSDEIRFWDPHVGAGPRATPTLHRDRLYTFGATGVLHAFDARTGRLQWSRDVAAETGAAVPTFGFASSPLLLGNLVVVHTRALAAYDSDTGEPRWLGPEGAGSYSSPQAAEIAGIPQILMWTHSALVSVAPLDGTLLWQHEWAGLAMTQPIELAGDQLLVSGVDPAAAPIGTRRLSITREGERWMAVERWTTNRLKPSFSSLVEHQGHAFGFDGSILTSIDVETGERDWKGGRYGSGQLLLLPEQDLLFVLTEQGEIALVRALPDGYQELARQPVLHGKCWSQPALVGNLLLVRNAEEMAAYRLPLAG